MSASGSKSQAELPGTEGVTPQRITEQQVIAPKLAAPLHRMQVHPQLCAAGCLHKPAPLGPIIVLHRVVLSHWPGGRWVWGLRAPRHQDLRRSFQASDDFFSAAATEDLPTTAVCQAVPFTSSHSPNQGAITSFLRASFCCASYMVMSEYFL